MNRVIQTLCVVALAAGSLLTGPALAATADDHVGQIARLQNQVTINTTPSKRGDLFANHDLIATGGRSYSVLRFIDSSTLYLRENSELRIEHVEHKPTEPEASSATLELISGGMRAVTGQIGRDNPEAVQYRTHAGVIGIRGTDFLASIVNRHLYLSTLDGVIAFTDPQGRSTLLEVGDTIVFAPTGEIVATGAEAARMAEEAGAFDDLFDADLSTDSLTSWGNWDGPAATDLRMSGEAMMLASTPPAGTLVDSSRLPIEEQNLDIPLLPGIEIGDSTPVPSPVTPGDGDNGFVDIGASGTIRGQLVWRNSSDLDLHLLLPGGGHVAYYNPVVTLEGGGSASLDHDNLGGQIDQAPDLRVENIFVTPSADGILPAGSYRFYGHYFSGSEATAAQITVTGDGGNTSSGNTETLSPTDRYTATYEVLLGADGSFQYNQGPSPAGN